MAYFNYHGTAKKLISEGKLTDWCFVERYKNISPALLLFFDNARHPVMPIREHRWEEYWELVNDTDDKP